MMPRILAVALLLPAVAVAQSPTAAPSSHTITAYPVQHSIVVDGRLDELDWQKASPATDFVQSEPRTGSPGTEKTEVRVLFDGDRLYIGAYLHDTEPDRLIVNDLRKDFAEDQQDAFEVILDTFHDRTNGYVFITNAAGARADRQVANEGREVNASWDGMWSVKTLRVSDGWTLEMAIPFKTLRFDLVAAPDWGINFARQIRRKNEIDFWSPVPRAFSLARVSLAGRLTGLSHDGTSHDLRIKPYAATRSIRDVGGSKYKSTSDGGIDVKYGLTQGLTLDVTVNPDFAQAEADEQTVNLTQFSQFFPEKREFFLENSGIFYVGDAARNTRVTPALTSDEDMVLFFSRRIGLSPLGRELTIPAGVRLTGNIGAFNIGLLSMNTGKTPTSPGNQYSAIRIRRSLFTGTDIGVILLDREGTTSGSDWNRVAGIDGNARLPGNWDWNSYAVASRKPGISGGQYAYRSTVNHEGNFFHAKGGVLEVGEGFSDDLGYFRRTNTRKYLLDTGIRPRPAWLAPMHVREMHPHIVWSYYENLDHQMTAKSLHNGYTFFFSDGSYAEASVNPNYQRIAKPFAIDRAVTPIAPGGYSWTTYQVRGATNLSRPFSLQYTLITGGLWNGTQVSEQLSFGARPSVNFNGAIGVNHTAAKLDQADGKFDALLLTARANYSFSTDMFLDALTQYDPRGRLFNANMRFNLIHHPLSDLFVVVNHQRIATPDAPDIKPGLGVIVKYTQMFSL
ncbi:MAG: DUF5916 domain-containing protein [Gemmatimonadaceae bacterium]